MKTHFFISITALLLFACGPSKEEVAAREKAKMDSVAKATEQNLARQQAVQDSIESAAMNQEALKAQLIDLMGQLAGEESKLNSIAEFTLLRTADEKAAQIAHQTIIVEQLKAQISEIEKQINN